MISFRRVEKFAIWYNHTLVYNSKLRSHESQFGNLGYLNMADETAYITLLLDHGNTR